MFLNETWTCAWNSMWWRMSLLLLVCFNNKCLLFFVRLFTITTPNKMKWNILSLFRMMMKCSEWATVTHHREVLVHSSSKIVQPNEKCFIKQDVRAFFIRSVYKYINIYIYPLRKGRHFRSWYVVEFEHATLCVFSFTLIWTPLCRLYQSG